MNPPGQQRARGGARIEGDPNSRPGSRAVSVISENRLSFRVVRVFRGFSLALLACAAVAALALLLASCSTAPISLSLAPVIPGATFVGDKTCAECHKEICHVFPASAHARIRLDDPRTAGQTSCEFCHGPASLHVANAGARQFIVNPGRDPAACYECHRATEVEFHLPQHHPLPEQKMSCAQCHDPHGTDIFKPPGGLAMARHNETCAQCHREQTRPFVFEHPALREGCTVCHSPHGSINAKLLIQRDLNLCLRCHAQTPGVNAVGKVFIGNVDHTALLAMGACWSSGCHTAVHGSNVDIRLRY